MQNFHSGYNPKIDCSTDLLCQSETESFQLVLKKKIRKIQEPTTRVIKKRLSSLKSRTNVKRVLQNCFIFMKNLLDKMKNFKQKN